jgi:hypothetical protein
VTPNACRPVICVTTGIRGIPTFFEVRLKRAIQKDRATQSIKEIYEKTLTIQEWPFTLSLVRQVPDKENSDTRHFWHSSGDPVMTQNVCSGWLNVAEE